MALKKKIKKQDARQKPPSAHSYPWIFYILIIVMWGLWPFNFRQANRVIWLESENGLAFETYGIVYGPEKKNTVNPKLEIGPHNAISIEIFLKPGSDTNENFASILCLFDDDQSEIFSLSQVKSFLNLSISTESGSMSNWRWLKNVFLKEQKRLLTIQSDRNSTTVYIDGKMAKKYPKYSLLPKGGLSSTWRLVIGNAPSGRKQWKGEIYGLAIYSRPLSAGRIYEHFEKWTRKSAAALLNEKDIIALYPIDEKKGSIIHNVIDNRFHLFIPHRFKIIRLNFFQISWSAFNLKFSTLWDIGINLLGFIPLGYFILSQRVFLKVFQTSLGLSIGLAVLCGFCISLVIEILQAYLPVRYSSLSDLIFNALGTGIGALLAAVWMSSKNKLMANH